MLSPLRSVVLVGTVLTCLALAVADDPLPGDFWAPITQSLDGPGWVLNNANRSIRVSNLSLPSSVWTALVSDPLVGYTERDDWGWVTSDPYWHWSLVFAPNQSLWYDFSTWHTELVVTGIDTLFTILVNGLTLADTTADNGSGSGGGDSGSSMLREYVYDVSGILLDNSQYNRIDVYCFPIKSYTDAMAARYPYEVDSVNYGDTGGGSGSSSTNRSFVRRSTSMFGWDFAPQFGNIGPWKHIELRGYNQGWIVDFTVGQRHLTTTSTGSSTGTDSDDDSGHSVWLNVTVYIRSPAYRNTSGTVTVTVANRTQSAYVSLPAPPPNSGEYLHSVTLTLTVTGVALWWPVNYGGQPLYEVVVTFNATSTGTQTTHTKSKMIGFRTFTIDRSPIINDDDDDDDSGNGSVIGQTFRLTVNNQPVFVKGATVVPLDPFPGRIAAVNETRLLRSLSLANVNLVRVWGGGPPPSDAFYDYCDRHGILVWQQFDFVEATFPIDDAFLAAVFEELKQLLLRLQSHPSVVVINGNSRIEWLLYQQGFASVAQHHDQYLVDYNELFVNTVDRLIARYIGPVTDGSTSFAYLHSSPSNGPLSLDPYTQRWGDPNDPHYGDCHYYPRANDSDDSLTSAFTWPPCKFVSEAGFPSLTSRLTLAPVALSDSDIAIGSEFLHWRQRYHFNLTDAVITEIAKNFRLPGSANQSLSYDAINYLSQLTQGSIYRDGIEALRRNKSTIPTWNSGVVFGQWNQIWQTLDFSLLEYGGRWKAGMYAVKRAFEPVTVSASVSGSVVSVYVVSDLLVTIEGSLTVSLHCFTNNSLVKSVTVPYQSTADSVSLVYQWSLSGSGRLSEYFVSLESNYTRHAGNSVTTVTNTVMLASLRDTVLRDPAIVVAVTVNDTDTVNVTLTAQAYAPYTFVETSVSGFWIDNSVMLFPSRSLTLTFVGYEEFSITEFESSLTVRTLYEVSHCG